MGVYLPPSPVFILTTHNHPINHPPPTPLHQASRRTWWRGSCAIGELTLPIAPASPALGTSLDAFGPATLSPPQQPDEEEQEAPRRSKRPRIDVR